MEEPVALTPDIVALAVGEARALQVVVAKLKDVANEEVCEPVPIKPLYTCTRLTPCHNIPDDQTTRRPWWF